MRIINHIYRLVTILVILTLTLDLKGFQLTQSDTVLAKQYYLTADSLHEAGQYETANTYYEKSAFIYGALSDWESYALSLNMSAECMWRISDFKKARQFVDTALDISLKYLDPHHKQLFDAYTNYGDINLEEGDYKKALEYFHKTLSILKEKYELDTVEHIALTYNNIGICHDILGDHDKSLEYFTKSMRILEELNEDSLDIAMAYNNVGLVLSTLGHYDQSLEYHLKDLLITKPVLGDYHPDLAYTYANIATLYNLKGNYQEALTYLLQDEEVMHRSNPNSRQHAASLANLGNTYRSLGEYDKALEVLQKCLKIRTAVLPKNHSDFAFSYLYLANLYAELDQMEKANNYYEKAIALLTKNFGPVHTEVIGVYIHAAQSSIRFNQTEKALAYLQNALKANCRSFERYSIYKNPVINEYINGPQLLATLKTKGILLKELFHSSQNMDFLEASLNTFMSCDTLIMKLHQTNVRSNDKLQVSAIAQDVYEEAINTSVQLHKLTKDPTYATQAFYFSEKSRSNVLKQSLNTAFARNFSGIPDSLVSKEKCLNKDKAKIQTLMAEAIDSTDYSKHQMELFELNRQLDELLATIETDYPKYHQLKYQYSFLALEQLQSKMSPNQAFIEVFEGARSVSLFALTKQKLIYSGIPKDSSFNQVAQDFSKVLKEMGKFSVSETTLRNYQKLSNQLYHIILEELLEQLPGQIDNLVIIPSGQLAYFPWEILVTKLSDDSNLQQLSYLLKSYTISYTYSANLYFDDKVYARKSEPMESVLAMAPSYAGIDPRLIASEKSIFRNEITPLVWNSKEAEAITEALGGKSIYGDRATEERFKKLVPKYQILHLAMHALVDNENPLNSKLVFYQHENPEEDNMLHGFELFNMEIPAELVVLSACNTGIGKLQQGEGVMSIAKAFSYAGCPSILMSHWKVDDQSTAMIMEDFYKHLAQGAKKDEALRLAKLKFLETSDPIRANPYYWSAFVLTGNPSSIDLVSKNNYELVLAIAASIFLLLLFVLWRKKRATSR